MNTIGSKSNDFELQKYVVVIKENLEIKEQIQMYFKKGKVIIISAPSGSGKPQ